MTKIPGNLAQSLRPSRAAVSPKRLNTWQSVRADVLQRIRSREWQPGELIPTEEQLAAQLGCARATVNRALRELAESGVIERRRKVGTRVASTPSRRTTIEMPSLRHEIEAIGASYGYVLSSFSIVNPNADAMRALQVDASASLIKITSKFLADDQPHCCETLWLNPELLPELTEGDLAETPAHEWLASHVALTHGRYSILASAAGGLCADSLQIDDGTPVLIIERTNLADVTPVSYAHQMYRPQHRLVSED